MLRLRSSSPRFFRIGATPGRYRPKVEELETRTLMSASSAIPASLLSLVARPAVSIATVTDPTEPPFTPSAIRSAYGFNDIEFTNKHGGVVKGNGAGQTIAIVDAYNDPDITGDLATFDATFGLPAPPTFTILNENGTANLRNVANSPPSSWALEESIDVEWAHAIAPGANIVLFEANASDNIDLDTADVTAATPAVYRAIGIPAAGVVSDSWYTPEGTNPQTQETKVAEQFEDAQFFQPISNQDNVTVVAAAGDIGTQGYPAVSPYVLGVGATALTVKRSGKNGVSYASETAWTITPDSDSPTGFLGTGGGTSQFEPEPAYQIAYGIDNTGGFRASPDVSMEGAESTPVNFVDSYDFPDANPTNEFAYGTSVATPMWSALLTIVNQGRALRGKGVLANAQEAVYEIPELDFHDITSGFNLVASAGRGYDEVTGIGTPIANLVVSDLIHVRTGPVFFPGQVDRGGSSATPFDLNENTASTAGVSIASEAPAELANTPPAIAALGRAGLAYRTLASDTPTFTLSSGSSVVAGETADITALSEHATAVLEGFHADADAALVATDVDLTPTEPIAPAGSSDLQTPAVEPAIEFRETLQTALQAGTAADAVFADYGLATGFDIKASATPIILSGEETHSIDLAIMANLALALGGSWSSAARAEEFRKHPALRS
jgi:hypothetical protein